MIRRVLVGLGLAVVGLVALVGFEILMLSRREYLPEDPGYRVDARVDPSSGSPGATPVRLAVLGDSTVVGVGSPTERESLPVLIAQRVADGAGRSVQVVGFGISGARTGSLPSEQLPVPDGFDVVVLVVGSNDATHATPWLEVRQQTIEMLDPRSRAPRWWCWPAGRASAAPRSSPSRCEHCSIDIRGSCVTNSARQLPDSRAFDSSILPRRPARASGGSRLSPDATSLDGFHPSPVGYGFWAVAIAPAVVEGLEAG